MKFCQRCVYPITAVNIDVDDENICSSCRFTEQLDEISKFLTKNGETLINIIFRKESKNLKFQL